MLRTLTFALVAATLALPGTAMAKGAKHCPPGLAKKSPACVPPGLAKKGVEYEDDRYDRDDRDDDEWYGDRYDRIRVGDRIVLNGDDYHVVRVDDGRVVLRRDGTDYRLPRTSDGSDYVRMGDLIVKVDGKTKTVVDWVKMTDLILR